MFVLLNSIILDRPFLILIKERSQVITSIFPSISARSTFLAFVLSNIVTFLLVVNFQSNCPLPTSIQYTCFALFFNNTSVKPPVDAPISTQTFSLISTSNFLIASESLTPPLETHSCCLFKTLISIFSENLTPAFSIFFH